MASVFLTSMCSTYPQRHPKILLMHMIYILFHSSENWKGLDWTLSQNTTTLSAYLWTWRLKLNHTKTVTAIFHLSNGEAKLELNVYYSNRFLPFLSNSTYVEIKLDKNYLYRHTAEATCKLRMGSGAKTLHATALSLV